MCLMVLHAFSQNAPSDTSGYKPKVLRLDEVEIVSSYYQQTADKSAVSGGQTGPMGSANVTDLSNGIEIKFVGWDKHQGKNTLTVGIGYDHHTAASQAWVSKTGASKTTGSRIYPSPNWAHENALKGTGYELGAIYSTEYNYRSIGLDAGFSKKTRDKNGEFSAKLTTYFDEVKLIYPSEFVKGLITNNTDSTIYITGFNGQTEAILPGGTSRRDKRNVPSSPRDTYSASFSYSQVFNARMQGSVEVDLVEQHGYLGLPFHRVYFSNGQDTIEKLPSQRFKFPIGFRLNYFLGDNVILKGYYRFYIDNWGVRSQTASLEVPVKITPFFSVSPFYRYYVQTAANYFAPFEKHLTSDTYYTSNYALSAFSANLYGVGLRLAPPKGILDKHFNALELRYGHYTETTDLVSNVISLDLRFR
jgi:Protein of unknown function (DUF3570)